MNINPPNIEIDRSVTVTKELKPERKQRRTDKSDREVSLVSSSDEQAVRGRIRADQEPNEGLQGKR
jgi:hypothetical protein